MEERRLLIMRHATAGPGSGRDHARRLTSKGLDEAHRVGLSLRARGAIPQRALCSSAVRCHETWQAVSAGLGSSPPVDFEDTLYNASAESLLHALAALVEEESILILAHNPGVSVLALELARGDDERIARLRAGFTPAATACFDVEGPWSQLSSLSARFSWFLRASEA